MTLVLSLVVLLVLCAAHVLKRWLHAFRTHRSERRAAGCRRILIDRPPATLDTHWPMTDYRCPRLARPWDHR